MFRMSIRGVVGMTAAGFLVAGAAYAADPPAGDAAKTAAAKAPTPQAAEGKAGAASDEVAVMETSKGRMVVEFWAKEAPGTVANFKKLARQSFFDGTGFHRIIKGFMIQGGDPNSKNPKAGNLGTGDPGYKIKDEFNSHRHEKGVLSMANSGTPNSAGSQFFIMHGMASHLDGHYTAFGRVFEGIDVLDQIANTPVGPNAMMGGEMSKPLEWTTLKSVRIMPRAAWLAKKDEVTKAAAATKAGDAAKMDAMKAAAAAKNEEAKKQGEAIKAKLAAEKAAADSLKAKAAGTGK
ncbi:MAG TPA: peptidylprolyl isomerase, partial [Candidatus Eisenbacteria bacterium]|nr:peptidylprolyl isomerase [Candidatus Eisenbacteria bacterium]